MLTTARLSLLAMVALRASALGQDTGSLSGRVRDTAGSGLSGAAVILDESVPKATTDGQGRFELAAVPSGRYRLVVSAIGFSPAARDVTVRAGEETRIDVTLSRSAVIIGELATTAAPAPGSVRIAPAVANGMIWAGTKNEIVQVAGLAANLAEKSGRQVFAKVPGVFVYDMDGSGNQLNVSTRGLDPHRSWELNVRQDGVLLNSDLYGYPASHYSPPLEAIERLEVTRGTAALQYGSQFGGLLNYVTKRPPADSRAQVESINSAGGFGLLSTHSAVGGTVGRIQYYGYFNERRSDGYRATATSTGAAQYLGVSVALSSSVRARAQLGHSTYVYRLPGPLTDAQFAANPRAATRNRNYYNPDIVVPAIAVDWHSPAGARLMTTVSGLFGPRNSVQFLGFATQPDLADGAGQMAPRQVDIDRFRSVTAESRLTLPWKAADREQTLAVGFAVGVNRMRRQQGGIGTRGDDFDLSVTAVGYQRDVSYRTINGAIYAENLFRLSPRWAVVPGLRYELGRTKLTGRLAYYDPADTPREVRHRYPLLGLRTTYGFSPATEFYAGFSQSYRPQILKDVLPGSALERTDPAIRDSRGWTLETGVRGMIGSRIRYDATAFELRIGNRFGTLLETDGSASYLYRTNVGSSRTRGIELAAEALVVRTGETSIRVHTATSWYDGRYRDGTVVSGGRNVTIAGNKVESVPEWITRSGLVVEGGRGSVQALVSHVSSTFADPLNTVDPSANGAVGRVPGYTVVDLNVAFRATDWLRLRGGISNLFDRQYFTKRPQFYPGPGIWPSDGRAVQTTIEIRP